MPEQLQKIINRVVEWWKKFNTKQKALMISLTSIVIVALVILGVVMTRPTYTTLIDCENAKSANQVKEILDADGTIDYKVSNSTHFEVNVKDESAANMLLGSMTLRPRDMISPRLMSHLLWMGAFPVQRQISRN